MKKQTITVEVKLTLEVEVPAQWTKEDILFCIEENSCPATQLVGHDLMKLIEEHESACTCWGCACQGENRVLAIGGVTL